MSKFQRAMTLNKNNYFVMFANFNNLIIILYQISNNNAPSCYTFGDNLITKFHYDP